MDTATISAWGSKLIDICTSLGIKIVLALLILIIGRIVIKKLLKGVGKIKGMDKVDPAVRSFLMNFFKIALYIVLVISIISVLGVPMASVITVLATAGLAIGMALQGALANFAGGIMLLIFRPFNIGDLISAAEAEGVVKVKVIKAEAVRHEHHRIIRNAFCDPVVAANGLEPPDFVGVVEGDAVHLVGAVLFQKPAQA